MNDLLKNPLILFVAMLLAVWLLIKLLKLALWMSGPIILILVLAFVLNGDFRRSVRSFFNGIFNN